MIGFNYVKTICYNVIIGATTTGFKQLNFRQFTQIDGKQILSCEVLSNVDLATSQEGAEVISDANLANLTITLFDNNDKKYDAIPATLTNARINSGVRATLDLKAFNSQKSFIGQNTGTGFTVGDAVIIMFNYIDNN
jgi:hypothetical protein